MALSNPTVGPIDTACTRMRMSPYCVISRLNWKRGSQLASWWPKGMMRCSIVRKPMG